MSGHQHRFSQPIDALPALMNNGHRPLGEQLASLTVAHCIDCGLGRVRARAKPGADLTPSERNRALRLAVEAVGAM
jgi:hypothetical protein